MIGQTLSHFKVTAKLGEGGMGEVYRAEDTKLGREVALKVLPEAFTEDPERFARFEREAHLLASLNHPNIAAIYDLTEDQGTHFLVLELVEGEDLAARTSRGPVPVENALALALQIAAALEAAHDKGIVHRDLKPANVMVGADGTVKVLDFGLAKAWEEPGEASPELSQSPTLTAQMTQVGVLLGTAAYMSPEQARGQQVDRRADIWALGCVLFEMMTGEQPFEGDTVSDVLAAILAKEPDWGRLDARVPPPVARLVRRCLVKDERRRLRDAGDAHLEIEELLSQDPSSLARSPAAAPRPLLFRALPWALFGAALIALAIVSLPGPQSSAGRPQAVRMSLDLDLPTGEVYRPVGPSLGLSPDGSRLAYVAWSDSGTQLHVRLMDSLHAIALPETDGAWAPFFSPDGSQIGFFSGGKLKKVPVTGERVAQTLCDAAWVGGGSWSSDGTIVFAPSREGPLARVSSSGGEPVTATRLDEQQGERLHRWPQVLPGGERVLFTSAKRRSDFEDATIEVESLETGERTPLIESAYYGRYLPTGHLLFVRRGSAYVVPFDLDRLAVIGTPSPVIEELFGSPITGWADLSFSLGGHLVYVKSSAVSDDVSAVWVDRQGRTELLLDEPAPYVAPRFSPDGERLAMHVGGSFHHSLAFESDIWILDLQRDALTRVTQDPAPEFMPVWTPDGERLVFSTERGGGAPALYWVRADGSGPAERLTRAEAPQYANSWTPDGRLLVLIQEAAGGGFDLWTQEFDEEGPAGDPRPLLEAQHTVWRSEISPDGRWLAYTSTESGIQQIYVRPFPGLDGKWQISVESENYRNLHARWSHSTQELFYWNGSRMMVVPYEVQDQTFVARRPQMLFEGEFAFRGWPEWDVAPNGQRFVMFVAEVEEGETEAASEGARVVLVLNWFSELEPR